METSSIPSIAGIDAEQALSRMDGRTDMFWRLLSGFNRMLESAPQQLQQLQGDELQGWLHQLKGNSGNMSAAQLHQLSSAMEARLKHGQVVTDEQRAELLAAIQLVLNSTTDALTQQNAAETTTGSGVPVSDLIQKLNTIQPLVESDYGTAMRLFEEVQPQLAAVGWQTMADTLMDSFYEFDSDAISSALRQLIDEMEKS